MSSDALIEGGRRAREAGRLDDALAAFQEAVRLAPASAHARVELGLTLRLSGRSEEAEAWFEQALSLDARSAEAHAYLGNLSHERGRLDIAMDHYHRALEADPANAAVHYNLALTLLACGEAAAAVASFRRALDLDPNLPDAESSLLFAETLSEKSSPDEVARDHREWGRRLSGAAPRRTVFPNSPDPERKLRVGYVTSQFANHVAEHFIRPFLKHHDREATEVFCYHNQELPEETPRFGHVFRNTLGVSDNELAQTICEDAIDVLVDLAGHTRGNRLAVFARKPAPVQCTFLGYPNSSGLEAMDWRLTDSIADPPGSSEHRYCEKLARLPHSVWCYAPPDGAPEPGPLPALQNGFVTFGSFNNVAKLNEPLIEMWRAILRELPSSKLVVATMPAGRIAEAFAARFERRGISGERVEILPRLGRAEYWGLHRRVDIALDSYPCNGGGTTCDSLWMGVPVVTRAGGEFASRAGASLLAAAGLREWIAQDEKAYVTVAVEAARGLARLERLRVNLREQLLGSPLCDAERFTRDLEALYREMWRDWCARRGR